jgi:predicted transcriptional regulator
MPRKPSPQPTDVELAILRVLWEHGPSSVRQVHNLLKTRRRVGYSTTLKMMQVMHEKGLLLRDERVRPQLYRAARSREKTQVGLIDDLVEKAFGGAASRLLVRALSAKRVSPAELAEIKRLIHELEGEQK